MKAVLFSLIVASIFLFSCRVKDTCELDNTGEIFVTNNTNSNLEVYIDNTKTFELTAGETKSTAKTAGNYTVKCLSFPEEWSYQVSVVQCESSEIFVPE